MPTPSKKTSEPPTLSSKKRQSPSVGQPAGGGLAQDLLRELATPELLLSRDAEGSTALLRAARDNNAALVRFLAPIEPQALALANNKGQTPLLAAVQGRCVEAVQALLETQPRAQCEPKKRKNASGEWQSARPMDLAASLGHIELVRILAPFSAHETRPDPKDFMELAMAGAFFRRNWEMFETLAELVSPAELNAVDDSGRSLLCRLASGFEYNQAGRPLGAVKALLARPDLNALNKRSLPAKDGRLVDGWSPLHQAIGSDNIEVFQQLAPFFDLNEMREANKMQGPRTPLSWAVAAEAIHCFEALLPQCDASLTITRRRPNIQATLDHTPLQEAIDGELWPMADALAARMTQKGLLDDAAWTQTMQEAVRRHRGAESIEELFPKTRAAREANALRATIEESAPKAAQEKQPSKRRGSEPLSKAGRL